MDLTSIILIIAGICCMPLAWELGKIKGYTISREIWGEED